MSWNFENSDNMLLDKLFPRE